MTLPNPGATACLATEPLPFPRNLQKPMSFCDVASALSCPGPPPPFWHQAPFTAFLAAPPPTPTPEVGGPPGLNPGLSSTHPLPWGTSSGLPAPISGCQLLPPRFPNSWLMSSRAFGASAPERPKQNPDSHLWLPPPQGSCFVTGSGQGPRPHPDIFPFSATPAPSATQPAVPSPHTPSPSTTRTEPPLPEPGQAHRAFPDPPRTAAGADVSPPGLRSHCVPAENLLRVRLAQRIKSKCPAPLRSDPALSVTSSLPPLALLQPNQPSCSSSNWASLFPSCGSLCREPLPLGCHEAPPLFRGPPGHHFAPSSCFIFLHPASWAVCNV